MVEFVASCRQWPWLQVKVGCDWIALEGELDVATAAWVPGVAEVLDGLRGSSVRFDLGGLTFVDCAGLRCLASLEDDLRERGIVVQRGSTSNRLDRLERMLEALGSRGSSAGGPLSEPRQTGSEIH